MMEQIQQEVQIGGGSCRAHDWIGRALSPTTWVNKGMYVAFPQEVGFVCMSLNEISNVWIVIKLELSLGFTKPYSLSIDMHYRGLITTPLMFLSHDGTKTTKNSNGIVRAFKVT
jgi:hypothetical protein